VKITECGSLDAAACQTYYTIVLRLRVIHHQSQHISHTTGSRRTSGLTTKENSPHLTNHNKKLLSYLLPIQVANLGRPGKKKTLDLTFDKLLTSSSPFTTPHHVLALQQMMSVQPDKVSDEGFGALDLDPD
jgi:hypothetical protein